MVSPTWRFLFATLIGFAPEIAVASNQALPSSMASSTVLPDWIVTVDHKKLGIMYVLYAIFFLLVAGAEAIAIRIQLAQPNSHFLSPQVYNRFFTMHGTTMVFLVGMPMVFGFANYLEANGGLAVAPHVVTRIRTTEGKVLYERQPEQPNQVIEPRNVAAMNTMMEETLLSGTAHKAELPAWTAAGKTGTSQDFRDAWFIGYTARLVAGIWLGNDDNTPTKHAVGGGVPVEIWSRFMRSALSRDAPAPLPGLSEPGWFGAPFGAPAPAPVAEQPSARQDSGGGLDNWLLDKLFGRR